MTILRDDGCRRTYRIVGEDEADPSRGTISYVSPVARALVGKKIGDVVRRQLGIESDVGAGRNAAEVDQSRRARRTSNCVGNQATEERRDGSRRAVCPGQ